MEGVFSTISIEQIIARTKLQLRLQDSSEDDFIAILSYEALRHLGCYSMYAKKQCRLTVCDGKLKLPKTFMRFIAMRMSVTNDTSGNICGYVYYTDRKFLSDCGCANISFQVSNTDSVIDMRDGFQIQSGYVHFHNAPEDGTEFELAFLGLNTDKNGDVIIYEDYERAIVNYNCFNIADSLPGDKYPETKIKRWQRTWNMQKAMLKGRDQNRYFSQAKREVQTAALALVTSRFVNYTS